MAQIRRGSIRLLNGQNVARHVWTAIFTSTSGVFAVGDALSWAGGGVGEAVRYVAPSKTLYFVRTSGPEPAVGTEIQGLPSGATATIAEMGASDPPGFDTAVPSGVSVLVSISGAIAPYWLSGVPGTDSLTLSAPWGQDTVLEASYGLHTAFSAWGLPLIEVGDIGAAVLVSQGWGVLEARARKRCWVGLTANALVANSTVPWDRPIYDPDGWLQEGGGLRVPAGVSLIELTASLWFTNSNLRTLRWNKNGLAFDGAPLVKSTFESAAFSSGPLEVAEGDIFTLLVQNGPFTVEYSLFSWAKARVFA